MARTTFEWKIYTELYCQPFCQVQVQATNMLFLFNQFSLQNTSKQWQNNWYSVWRTELSFRFRCTLTEIMWYDEEERALHWWCFTCYHWTNNVCWNTQLQSNMKTAGDYKWCSWKWICLMNKFAESSLSLHTSCVDHIHA